MLVLSAQCSVLSGALRSENRAVRRPGMLQATSPRLDEWGRGVGWKSDTEHDAAALTERSSP